MFLRAIFFIAALALLAPSQTGVAPTSNVDVAGLAQSCNNGACTIEPGTLETVKTQILANLMRVKADIAEAERQRDGG